MCRFKSKRAKSLWSVAHQAHPMQFTKTFRSQKEGYNGRISTANVHTNERAIALYKKLGFVVEGVRERDLKYGKDCCVDTVVMGRFV
jgi:RimJ/RimL family protein N-acetyltransferase